MSYKYVFIGWCKNEKDNHDKVWGIIQLNAEDTVLVDRVNRNLWPISNVKYDCVIFWGRRGKKLQDKVAKISHKEILKLIVSKQYKGYKPINKNELDVVYPEFEDDLKKTVFWSTFKV